MATVLKEYEIITNISRIFRPQDSDHARFLEWDTLLPLKRNSNQQQGGGSLARGAHFTEEHLHPAFLKVSFGAFDQIFDLVLTKNHALFGPDYEELR